MKGRGHGAAQRVAKDRRAADAKLVHIRSSGLKAASTWHRVEILQACRECCGGMGAFTSLCLTWTDSAIPGSRTDIKQPAAKHAAVVYSLNGGMKSNSLQILDCVHKGKGAVQAFWLPTRLGR